MFCLPPKLLEIFKEKMRSGEITPDKLTVMTSAERRSLFSTLVGDVNAKQINALFESKLLLKNQQQGILNWAKQVVGMKPDVMRDIITRVNKMEEVLNPESQRVFLEDLVAHKLGTTVTMAEAARISELAKETMDARKAMESGGDRMDYGRSAVRFDEYIQALKDGNKSILSDFNKPIKAVENIAGLAKSMKATLDNSVIGRQGLKVLFTHPGIWLKNSLKTFSDIVKTFGGKEVIKEVIADVRSRENSLNGLYKKEKLAVGVIEEAYPSKLPQKIPLFGRAFKASEAAFTAFQYRTRADIFDKYIEIAQKSGADITGIGKVANSLTGRGSLGRLEPAANVVNNVFFSPRFLKSNIDILTAHIFDANMSAFARKQAAVNTIKVVGGIAAVLTIADAIAPGSVEKDPRSSDFGKIKIGNTRFDVSGGVAPLVVLAMRQIKGQSKSSTTGLISDLGSQAYGAQTRLNVFYNFFENKLSPAMSVVRNLMRGKDFSGKKPTVKGELTNLFAPIPITNYLEVKDDPNAADTLLVVLADALGIGTNTYSATEDWTVSPGKELSQFQKKVGNERFVEANEIYNQQLDAWISSLKDNQMFSGLEPEAQKSIIIKKKTELKDIIYKRYGFKYKQEPTKKLPKF